jgi:hypothetical protein
LKLIPKNNEAVLQKRAKRDEFEYLEPEVEEDFDLEVGIFCFNVGTFNALYIGQVREGTTIREGKGIVISQFCLISEGNWKNDKLNGKTRIIDCVGNVFYLYLCRR